ncbi:MAG: hypothetical protein WD114_01320 [Phycisphaerales bacterium]
MSFMHTARAVAFAAIASTATAADFDEQVLGDFSDDNLNPTFLGFEAGMNTVTMDVVLSDQPDGDRDYFTFTLGAGQYIDSITVLESSNPAGGFDAAAFVGLAYDSIFDFDPDTFMGDGLVGYVITTEDLVGTDILTDLTTGPTTLEAGDYSFWVQQTGEDLTRVSLGFNVVPAPTTTALLSMLALTATRRRRG